MMYLLFTNLGGRRRRRRLEDGLHGRHGRLRRARRGRPPARGVAEDKSLGWLRQLRITPISRARSSRPRAHRLGDVLPAILAVLRPARWSTAYGWTPGSGRHWPCCCGSARSRSPCSGIGNGYRLSAQTTGVVNMACNCGLGGGRRAVVPDRRCSPAGCAPSPSTPRPTGSPSSAGPRRRPRARPRRRWRCYSRWLLRSVRTL